MKKGGYFLNKLNLPAESPFGGRPRRGCGKEEIMVSFPLKGPWLFRSRGWWWGSSSSALCPNKVLSLYLRAEADEPFAVSLTFMLQLVLARTQALPAPAGLSLALKQAEPAEAGGL